MSLQSIITAVLLLGISLIASTVIGYWHGVTRGTWRQWPAGQSLMALLVIIAVGFGFGGVNRFLGDYAAKDFILIALYTTFAAALVIIGLTIRKEMHDGKERLRQHKPKDPTGPVIITVATTNQEQTHGNT